MSALARDTLHEASLGEVAALTLKAARGAGYDWGLAEEAADAVRVLHAHGFAGARSLVAALDGPAEADTIRRGVYLSDRAEAFCADGPEDLHEVSDPVLLLPFLLRIATLQERALRVAGQGVSVVCLPDGCLCEDRQPSPSGPPLRVGPATPPWPDPLPQFHRAWLSLADWDRLNALAARTYAPATEASRLRGAGAADDPES